MRSAGFIYSLIGIGALALPAGAQSFVSEPRTVVPAEVEVRCGQSFNPKIYGTMKLHKGDVVEVVTNTSKPLEPGWLAIKPPRGSFSWIRAELVRQDGPHTGTVIRDGSPVLAGSSLTANPPSVRTAELPRGSLVAILDKPLVCSDGSKWLPIDAHPTELRYVPVSAVSPSSALQTVAAKTSGAGAGAVQLGGPTPAADAKTGASGSTSVNAGPTTPNGQYGQVPAVSPGQWSAVGWLRKSNFKNDDGAPIYWFYNSQNQFVHYVVGQPGTTLDQYLSQWVYLFGERAFRDYNGVRADFMTAKQVQLAK
jgi:hypothetical protein